MGVGAIIRQRREALGLTQDEVAAKTGISKPYLSNIETGRANPPSDDKLAAIETALGFAPGELTKLAHLARTPADVRQDREALEAEVQRLRGVLRDLVKGSRGEGAADPDAVAKQIEESQLGDGANIAAARMGTAIPIINKVAAGYPQHFTDLDYPPSVADEYIRCVDVHDPQAFGARVVGDSMEPAYREGDVVVFSPNTPVQSGDDCFVRFDGEFATTFKRVYQDGEQTVRLQPLNSKYASQVFDRQRITGLWPAVWRLEKVRR